VIDFERSIGRMLIATTYVSVALLVIGVALLATQGISPLSGGPQLDIGRLAGDLVRFTPDGFLWLGLLAVIATPLSRVVAAGIGYARAGDRALVVVAIAILAVIALSITSALAFG
jgi:uncharacterized membrane protein